VVFKVLEVDFRSATSNGVVLIITTAKTSPRWGLIRSAVGVNAAPTAHFKGACMNERISEQAWIKIVRADLLQRGLDPLRIALLGDREVMEMVYQKAIARSLGVVSLPPLSEDSRRCP
jgi:hypothetical protein